MDYFHKAGAKRVVGVAVLGGLVAAAACADILGVQSDRHLAAAVDSGVDAAVPYGMWDCLGSPAKLGDPTTPVTYTLRVLDAIQPGESANQIDGGSSIVTVQGVGIDNATVKECPGVSDTRCVDLGNMTAITDDAGAVTFPLSLGFNGYFAINQPGNLVPYTFYPGLLPPGDTKPALSVGVLTEDAIQGVAFALGPTVDTSPSIPVDGGAATAGMVFFGVYDCHDVYAPGVQVTALANPGGQFEYYATMGAGGDFLSLDDTYTTVVAAGGFMNVPVGTMTLKAQIATGDHAGTQLPNITVPVSAGAVYG